MSPHYENILDRPILSLSGQDELTFRALTTGIFTVGDPGSGKSSTSGKQLFQALLRANLGALCMSVKSEDTANYVAWARECGREADVIVFDEASGLRFDPLAYEWSSGCDVESIIEYFSVLLSLGRQNHGDSSERFWELAAQQAMRHAIKLIQLANEPLSIVHVHRAISSFPTYLGQQEESSWREQSYTASLIDGIRARKDTLSENQWQDLEIATQFVFTQWATLDERPRSSIAMTFAGMADRFLFHPWRRIFASGACDFTPEQVTHEHKIIISAFPVVQAKESMRLMQCMVKLTFQRAWLRHPYRPGCCNGAFLFQDEFQLVLHSFENYFAQLCRASGIATISMTQNILNLAEVLGETQPGSKTKAFLANLLIKIAHRSTCPETCNYFSDVIGKEYRYIDNYNAGSGGHATQHTHTSVGGARQLVHIVDPIEFTRLARPDGRSPFAEAIVYCAGDIFHATRSEQNPKGRNYLRVLFSRQ